MSEPHKNELRIYIVFRGDLPEMTRAKGEVQAAHAVGTLIYKHFTNASLQTPRDRDLMDQYFAIAEGHLGWVGQTKIAMEAKNEAALLQLEDVLVDAQVGDHWRLRCALIRDEGRTCFSEPTFTCLAFGPCTKDQAKPYLDAVGAKLRK